MKSLLLCFALGLAVPAAAQLLMTQEEALARAFKGARQVERKTLFLTEAQVAAIQEKAHAKVESRLVTYYCAAGEEQSSYAFFEKHVVRTKEEILMIVINADGRVGFVEMLAFYEPFDYLPTAKWLNLFRAAALTPELWPGRDIHNITGATLTTHAVTAGVRKTMAIFKIAIQSHRVENSKPRS